MSGFSQTGPAKGGRWHAVVFVAAIIFLVPHMARADGPGGKPCPPGSKYETSTTLDGFKIHQCLDPKSKRQGPFLSLWETGKKQSEGTYKNGYEHGHWTFWRRNGNKEKEGDYLSIDATPAGRGGSVGRDGGYMHGSWKTWH